MVLMVLVVMLLWNCGKVVVFDEVDFASRR